MQTNPLLYRSGIKFSIFKAQFSMNFQCLNFQTWELEIDW